MPNEDPERKLGVVLPITTAHFERLLSGRNVFCKFGGRTSPPVKPGNKVVFYQSGGSKQLLGEATIKSVTQMSPQETIHAFGDNLFINPDELDRYEHRFQRPSNPRLLVFELVKVRRYPLPVKISKPVTPAGLILTAEMYKTITRK